MSHLYRRSEDSILDQSTVYQLVNTASASHDVVKNEDLVFSNINCDEIAIDGLSRFLRFKSIR